jgi:hypothetical protein
MTCTSGDHLTNKLMSRYIQPTVPLSQEMGQGNVASRTPQDSDQHYSSIKTVSIKSLFIDVYYSHRWQSKTFKSSYEQ